MKIIKQEIQFEESLKQRLEFICEFSKVSPTFIKGSIRKIEKINLSYIEPHKVIVKNITLLVFNYSNIKKQLAEKEKKLDKANIQTNKLDNTTKDINQILDNLKPVKFNKNNMVISNEDVEKIKNFTKDVKDTTKTVRSVNNLNIAIRDFEHSAFEIEKENCSLKYQLEEKDKEIYNLKGELSTKDKIINKLKEEKESIKAQLHKFKEFWHSIMGNFHKRICYDKDNNYKIVSDDLYKNGIFTDDENEIANTKENYEKFDAMLKEVDEEYRTTLISFAKYKIVMFAMAKLMEMEITERNKVALYLFNNIV